MRKNKKKGLLLLSIFLYSGLAYGQSGSELYINSNVQGEMNMVRYSQSSNAFINASKAYTSTGFHFTLTDLNNMVDTYFRKNFEVRDIEILNDTIFFCGQDPTLVSGFIGWFSITDLFYGTGDIHIDNTLSAQGLLSLDNIEVYTDQGGGIHIAGYGVHSVSTDPYSPFPYTFVYTLYRAFEAVGNPATGMQYRVADLYSGGLKSDIKDMVVTNNFVVYLQCGRNNVCAPFIGVGIDLEVFPKYNMFSATHFSLGHFQTITNHTVSYPNAGTYSTSCTFVLPDNSDPHSSEAKMVHIGDDKVAVCSYRVDLDYSAWIPIPDCDPFFDNPTYCVQDDQLTRTQRYLTNRIYDISPILTNNPMVMVSSALVPLPGEVYEIDDFVYNNQKQSYVVVHRHERIPGIQETAFTTMDYTSGIPPYVTSDYEVHVNTSIGWTPTSVCLFGNDEYLVSGNIQSSYEQLFWKSGINYSVGNCDVRQSYPTTQIPTTEEKNNIWPIDASGWVTLNYVDYHPKEVLLKEVEIKCN